jgi:hypothetical protein
LFQDFKRINKYKKKLFSEVQPKFPDWNIIVDSENQKRMHDYILIQAMWTAGFCRLRGNKIEDNEIKAIVNISALAPLYDDFFDKVDMPSEKINALVNTPFTYQSTSSIENLFLEFSKRIHASIQDVPFYLENAKRVFNAQHNSKKLVSENSLSWEKVKQIAFEKGASTVICMCNMLNKKLSVHEEKLMFQLGGVAQYLDDLFDLREDFIEGRQTLANPLVKVIDKRKSFNREVSIFKSILKDVDYEQSNKKAFLFPITYILGATLLTLDRYAFLEKSTGGIFKIQEYSRNDLVVDMDKLSNRWKAFKWASKV